MEINAAVFRKVHEPLTIEAVPSLWQPGHDKVWS